MKAELVEGQGHQWREDEVDNKLNTTDKYGYVGFYWVFIFEIIIDWHWLSLVFSSMHINILTGLCNHCYDQNPERFHHFAKSSFMFFLHGHILPPPTTSGKHESVLYHDSLVFWDGLLSLIILSEIHPSCCVHRWFILFIAEYWCILWHTTVSLSFHTLKDIWVVPV